jgi:hypothetical protein
LWEDFYVLMIVAERKNGPNRPYAEIREELDLVNEK